MVTTDSEFVERTVSACAAGDKVWLAYALGTLENVDEPWSALERALQGLSITDLLDDGEAECESLKRRLVAEMCLTRTRTEMLEEFGPDYERWLDVSK